MTDEAAGKAIKDDERKRRLEQVKRELRDSEARQARACHRLSEIRQERKKLDDEYQRTHAAVAFWEAQHSELLSQQESLEEENDA